MPRIIVVDDNPTVRRLMCRYVKHLLGEEASEAPNPLVAERMMHEAEVRSEGYKLVFTDLEMPEAYFGREFLTFLAREFKGVKVVLMTGAGRDLLEEVEEPYDFYLPKPFKIYQVEEVLKEVLP